MQTYKLIKICNMCGNKKCDHRRWNGVTIREGFVLCFVYITCVGK
jgi:hypothetical protein